MKSITIKNPPFNWYLGKIINQKPFAFPKRTHGIWDHLSILESKAFEHNDYQLVDQMIFKRKMPSTPEVILERQDYIEYLKDLREDIRNPPKDEHYFSTVALSLDYLTKKLRKPQFNFNVQVDRRLKSYWQVNYEYSYLFDSLSLWDREWYYAQMPFRGIESGEIIHLPEAAQKYHVVVVGPKKLADINIRWGLEEDSYSFIEAPPWPDKRPKGNIFTDKVLPALQTYRMRFEYLEILKNIRTSKRILYLFEIGTLSQWLIHRLFLSNDTNTYIDMGRALELWFPDSDWPLKSPIKAHYKKTARKYFGEKYYFELIRKKNDNKKSSYH